MFLWQSILGPAMSYGIPGGEKDSTAWDTGSLTRRDVGIAVLWRGATLSQSEPKNHLPTEAAARKAIPVYSGVVKYFPDALVAIAKVSKAGNDQHNPGQPLHWSRGKSDDHHDTALRHLIESGTVDTDGHRHSAKLAWRALAILQLEIEKERAEKLIPSDVPADVLENDRNRRVTRALEPVKKATWQTETGISEGNLANGGGEK